MYEKRPSDSALLIPAIESHEAQLGRVPRLVAGDAAFYSAGFADETHIYGPIQGVSSFTTTFPQRGPRDRPGRSLRDFDVQTRMFRYPLSYMIYSETFDAMPDVVRERVYRRLYDVLSGKDRTKIFSRLSDGDRLAILEILLDTEPGLPAYWKASGDSVVEPDASYRLLSPHTALSRGAYG